MKKIGLAFLGVLSAFLCLSCKEIDKPADLEFSTNFDFGAFSSAKSFWEQKKLKNYSFSYELLTSSSADLWGIKANVTVINGTGSIKFVDSELDSESELSDEKIASDERCFRSIDDVFSYLNKNYSYYLENSENYLSLEMKAQEMNSENFYPAYFYGIAYLKNNSDKEIGKENPCFGVKIIDFSVLN